ncbi:sugar transferase [Priestia megaterium]|uniref:sugar transferase n=1 Tax=Priestia megaterium TaxID=1404 RepID=UPI0022206F7D|nr:sugar transferase [Priestia megaterium]
MYKIAKRIGDVILSFIGIILLSPFFLLIILFIKIDSKGPILFKQKRVGKNKKNFYILKFRTMKITTPKDMPTHLLENPESYITNAGKFLRKTSLDELPQVWNILIGDMSIVGPRPALWNQYDLIEERDRYGANNVLPGLTGLAQVSGRDELDIKEKAKIDGKYVSEIGLKMDLLCFLMTLISVIKKDGIIEGKKS